MNRLEPRLEIQAIDTPTLGDRSYLAYDGQVALVIDHSAIPTGY